MEEWKEQLRNTVEGLLESKQLTDYESVVAKVKAVYTELTQDIAKRNKSLFYVLDRKDSIQFHIYNYGLVLVRNGEVIDVLFQDEEPHPMIREKFAEIKFENGFSYIAFTNKEGSKFHLTDHYIDQLFKKAYNRLIPS